MLTNEIELLHRCRVPRHPELAQLLRHAIMLLRRSTPSLPANAPQVASPALVCNASATASGSYGLAITKEIDEKVVNKSPRRNPRFSCDAFSNGAARLR